MRSNRITKNTVDHGNGPEPNARERLLSSGAALFAEKGYATTSVREIVQRAGVTKPVLYYYFKNKEGIFRAILDWAASKQEDLLSEILHRPGTLLDRLLHLYRRVYEGVQENRDLFRFIHNLIFGPPQGSPEYDLDQYHRRMVATITRIYGEALARGQAREADAEDVAIIVISIIDFTFHLEQVHPHFVDRERVERLLHLACRGIMAEGKG